MCHAARLFIETVEGEVATAGVQYVVVRLLLGDQDHVHGQSPGAGACLGQDQGLHHLPKIAPPLPPHLRSVQVRIGPRLCQSVLTGRRVWCPMEMAPPTLLRSRGEQRRHLLAAVHLHSMFQLGCCSRLLFSSVYCYMCYPG